MKKSKQGKLVSKGWKFGTFPDFLNLTPEEVTYIDLKISLSESLKSHRRSKNMSQTELAQLIQTSQSRIAKMEAGDASVSLDLLIKSLLALGVTKKDLAKVISH